MFAVAAAAVLALPPTPYELLEAEALIRCPGAAPCGPIGDRRCRACEAVAVRLGLPGPRDVWYAWADGEAGVYYSLHAMLGEFEGMPPLEDAGRLPPWRWCEDAAGFNRKLAEGYRGRIRWEPDRAVRLEAAAKAADAHAAFWDSASWAGWPQATEHQRRAALRRVRDAVGADRYAAGDWPDAGPHWLLQPR